MVNSVTMATKAVMVINVTMATSLAKVTMLTLLTKTLTHVRMKSICFLYPIWTTTLVFLRILVKILNNSFHVFHSEVVELVHAGRPTDRRTERHDEANIRFLQRCCERALSMVCAR